MNHEESLTVTIDSININSQHDANWCLPQPSLQFWLPSFLFLFFILMSRWSANAKLAAMLQTAIINYIGSTQPC